MADSNNIQDDTNTLISVTITSVDNTISIDTLDVETQGSSDSFVTATSNSIQDNEDHITELNDSQTLTANDDDYDSEIEGRYEAKYDIRQIMKVRSIMLIIPFIMYISDIATDMAVAILFYIQGDITYCQLTICCVYITSVLTTVYERSTRSMTSLKYSLTIIPIFMLNISGVLLFMDLIRLKFKKYSDQNQKIFKKLLISTQILLTAETLLESLPQLFLQIYIMSDIFNNNQIIKVIQVVAIFISAMSFSFTITKFFYIHTCKAVKTSLFCKVITCLWLYFDTVLFLVCSTTYMLKIFTITGILIVIFPVLFTVEIYKDMLKHERFLKKIIFIIFLPFSTHYFVILGHYNTTKAYIARFLTGSNIVIILTRWIYYQDDIFHHFVFIHELIVYLSISCFAIGLCALILIIYGVVFRNYLFYTKNCSCNNKQKTDQNIELVQL